MGIPSLGPLVFLPIELDCFAKLTLTPSRIRSSSPTSKSRNMISIRWQVKNCKHWQRLWSITPSSDREAKKDFGNNGTHIGRPHNPGLVLGAGKRSGIEALIVAESDFRSDSGQRWRCSASECAHISLSYREIGYRAVSLEVTR